MAQSKNAFFRQLTKEFLFEDVSVQDTSSEPESLDAKVKSIIMDYDKVAVDEESDEEKLDIDLFTSKIANFVENYQKILDVQSHIVNSAMEHISENYDDEETLNKFKEILFDVYDIKLDSMKEDAEAPLAGAAGPAGGGA